jgi:hypothetical protein
MNVTSKRDVTLLGLKSTHLIQLKLGKEHGLVSSRVNESE